MLRIGLRAHDLGSFSCADALGEAAQNAKEGAFIQLALKKAIPSSRPWQEWDEEYISSIVSALSRHGVSVAMIGCYINPIEPDEEKRRLELDRFRKSLSLAKAFGCPYVGTETGTLNPKGGYSPDTSDPRNLAVFRDSLSQMVDAAERYGSYVAIEAVARVHAISTPERLASILDGFRSDHLKVILDPVNLIPWTGIPEKDGVPLRIPSEEAEHSWICSILDIIGPRLVAIHCKDYRLDPETGFKIGNLPALTGCFRWQAFAEELRSLHEEKADGENLRMEKGENVDADEIDEHDLHIRSHVRYMLSAEFDKAAKRDRRLKERMLAHIRGHRAMKALTAEANGENGQNGQTGA